MLWRGLPHIFRAFYVRVNVFPVGNSGNRMHFSALECVGSAFPCVSRVQCMRINAFECVSRGMQCVSMHFSCVSRGIQCISMRFPCVSHGLSLGLTCASLDLDKTAPNL